MAKGKALELTIKIAGQMDKSLTTAIDQAQGRISGFSQTISKIGTVGLSAMGAMATASVAAIVQCTDEAKNFEAQMGDVVKYVDGLADTMGKISGKVWLEEDGGNGKTYAENYDTMKKALLDLSTQIPLTAEDLTRLAAAAGQSGKSMEELIQFDENGNLQGFLKDTAMWATAMDISADQAGDWAAKWEKAFGKSHEEIMVLADQINYLGANSATTAAEIAEAVNSAASLGQIGGVSVSTTAALADAMLATGVNSGRVGTSIKRMITNLSKGSSATKAMKDQWAELGMTAEDVAKGMQEHSVETLKEVFNAIKSLPQERQVAALSTLFGQWAIEGGAKIVGNLDVFEDALNMVENADRYTGSMEREFTIKAGTTESIDTMLANTREAMKIEFGDAFLPARKELSQTLINIMNTVRDHMPELQTLAETLAGLFSRGVDAAGKALEKALPYIQQALDYLTDHGPEVISILGKIAAAFAAMKLAPMGESLLGGAASLLGGAANFAFGTRQAKAGGTGGERKGGVISSLVSGGQNLFSKMSGYFGSGFAAVKENGILTSLKAGKNTLSNAVGSLFSNSGIGRWMGGITESIKTLNSTKIGGGLINGLKTAGSTTIEILSNISQATGLTDAAKGAAGLARSGAGWVAGKASGLASRVANSGVGQAVGGFVGKAAPVVSGALGNVGELVSAGGGVIGKIFGPMASGFGSLFSGVAGPIAAISSVIAVISILGDHLEDIRGLVVSIFGEAGGKVFDNFVGVLQNVGSKITNLFSAGGVEAALSGFRDMLFGDGGIFAGNEAAMGAFDGLVQMLQSVMGIVGQIVTFANTTVKPIIQEIFSFLTQTVIPIILQVVSDAAPIISSILSNVGNAVMTIMTYIGQAIQAILPIAEKVIQVIMTIGSVVIPALLAYINEFTAALTPIIEGVKTVFGGIIDFISGIFTGNWKKAWEGVKSIFTGIFDTLGALFKTPINAVISLINKAISGINGLGLDIPDWVPVIGGKKFGINIPPIPLLATGGFTNGPSIAGEAGREAVISFLPGVRAQNLRTWAEAGRMLGVPDGELVTLPEIPEGDDGSYQISFAPQIVVNGNADRDQLEEIMREAQARFESWIEEFFQNRTRRAY